MGSNGNNDRLYFLGPQKQIVTAATKLKDVLSLEKRTMTKLVKSESHLVVSDSLQSNGTIQSMNSLGPNTGVGSLSLLQGIFPTQGSNPGLPHCRWILYHSATAAAAAAAKSLQSCPTMCNPIDGSLSGSPVPEILQAGRLEWVAISFSNT